ncbi:hypothetical protein H5368_13340 [Luteimonas sp. MC1782]|uniref:hypothetical protein n=1 Tax=Luteimonas sp. MC1782 TaxID=2760305 RepID=UPI0015FF8D35|nr:hypothetical protein [Luteimonas sp. MC1782]MBB1474014.1 hypothetical protein [Luteimonas sp. MC1782]
MIRRILTVLLLTLSSVACAEQPYQQVFAGYNGPDSPTTTYFQDEQSLRDSWVSTALQPRELDEILSKVRFGPQMLVVSAVGGRSAVTGVQLGGVERYGDSLSVLVLVGVADTHCPGPRPDSYPFVIGVVQKPDAFDAIPNYFHQNFPDECKAVKSGSPAQERPNNAFKPTPHRGANHMADTACHVLHAPLRRGLT